jgi:hypothetical protein
LVSHGALCFGAPEVMNFLGRKLKGSFRSQLVSDLPILAFCSSGGSRLQRGESGIRGGLQVIPYVTESAIAR